MRSRRTLQQRAHLCSDLLDAIDNDASLLEVIIDEYIYRLNDQELDELEDIMYQNLIDEVRS